MSVTETYILVPHLLRYVPWFARYLQNRTYPATYRFTYMTEIGFSPIVRLRFRAFGAQPPSELVIAWHDSDGGNAVYNFLFCVIVTLLN